MAAEQVKIPAKTGFGDETLVKLSREIAMNIHGLEDILKRLAIPRETFEIIAQMPRFQALLETAVAEWGSALNTPERVRIKSASVMEEWLVEAHRLLHDPTQVLSGKVELAKLISRLGNIDRAAVVENGAGERFSITINLGADSQLKFDKPVTSKVIDGEVVP
jgi:hypothetical protein